MGVIETIILYTKLAVTPVSPLLASLSTGVLESAEKTGEELARKTLAPIRAVIEGINGLTMSISIFVYEIFNWLLMNILTPIILIVGVILFVAFQYYLIRFYIKLVSFFISKITSTINFVTTNKKVLEYTQKVRDLVEETQPTR